MKLRRAELIALFITIASAVIGIYFYPQLPAKVASHWNAAGQVDGYMTRFWGVYLMPLVSLLCWVLFLIVPRLDPKKDNIAKFQKTFDKFIILLFLFLIYLYLITIAWNLGFVFNMIVYLIPAFVILIASAGELISKAEMNWSIGIRTPWTLTNETVWTKTHFLGGKLFKLSAVISILGLVWTDYAIWFVIVPIGLAALTSIVYSYLVYKKLPHN